MSNARCRMLAHPTDEQHVYRCPSTLYRFHYHAVRPDGPLLILDTMARVCHHKHATSEQAQKCHERGNR